MWRAGYDIEATKRYGRWKSASFQGYLWDEHRALSSLGKGVISTSGNTYQFAAQGEAYPHDNPTVLVGRAGGYRGKGKGSQDKGKGRQGFRVLNIDNPGGNLVEGAQPDTHLNMNPADRMRAISKGMSKELRHVSHPNMRKDGYLPMTDLLNTETLRDLRATQKDVRRVVRDEGGNWKKRFELGAMELTNDISVRACQCHSAKYGVRDDVLPATEGLGVLMHGTSLSAAKQIAQEGLCRQDRLHIHFYECDLGGNPLSSRESVRGSSEVIIIVSEEKCENLGIVFYRAPNGVILSAGLSGITPSGRFLCVRRLPCYEVLWSQLTRGWHARSDPNFPTQPRGNTIVKIGPPSSEVEPKETLSTPGLRRVEMDQTTWSSRDANDQMRSPQRQAGRKIEGTEEARSEKETGGRKRARSCETLRAISVCNTDKWNRYPDLPTPKQHLDSDLDMPRGNHRQRAQSLPGYVVRKRMHPADRNHIRVFHERQ